MVRDTLLSACFCSLLQIHPREFFSPSLLSSHSESVKIPNEQGEGLCFKAMPLRGCGREGLCQAFSYILFRVMFFAGWRGLASRASPVPVVQLNFGGQLFQGDAVLVPEGNVGHLADQLLQLDLHLLHDGQVVVHVRVLDL